MQVGLGDVRRWMGRGDFTAHTFLPAGLRGQWNESTACQDRTTVTATPELAPPTFYEPRVVWTREGGARTL